MVAVPKLHLLILIQWLYILGLFVYLSYINRRDPDFPQTLNLLLNWTSLLNEVMDECCPITLKSSMPATDTGIPELKKKSTERWKQKMPGVKSFFDF